MEFRDRPFLEIDWFSQFFPGRKGEKKENPVLFIYLFSVGDDSDGGLLLVRLSLPVSHDVCLCCCGCCKVWQVDSSSGWVTKPLKDFHTRRPVRFSSSTLFFLLAFLLSSSICSDSHFLDISSLEERNNEPACLGWLNGHRWWLLFCVCVFLKTFLIF